MTFIRQEYDLIASRGDAFLKYRPLKTRENKKCGFSVKCQNFFPNIPVLKYVISLQLKPPSFLGRHSLSHDFQCISLEFPPHPNQNCATGQVNFFCYSFR